MASNLKSYIAQIIGVILILFVTQNQIKAQDHNPYFELEEGIKAFQNFEYDVALKSLNQFLDNSQQYSIDPDALAIANYFAGTIYHIKEENDKSIQCLNRIINNKTLPEDVLIQANCLQLKNYIYESKFKDGESILELLTTIYQRDKNLDILEVQILYYAEKGNLEKLHPLEMDLLEITIPQNPSTIAETSLIIKLNTLYSRMSRVYQDIDLDKALSYLFKGLDTITEYNQENRSTLYWTIADIYTRKGDREKALYYNQLASGNNGEDISEDVQRIKRSIEGEKDNEKEKEYTAKKLMTLGVSLSENEQINDGIEKLEEALDLFSQINHMDYQAYVLSWLISGSKQIGDAQKYSIYKNRLKDLVNDNLFEDDHIQTIIFSRLGSIYEEEGNFNLALDYYEKALEKGLKFFGDNNPELYSYYYNLVAFSLKQGNLSSGRSYIEKLKSLPLKNDKYKDDFYATIFLESELLGQEGKPGVAVSLLEQNADEIINGNSSSEIKSLLYTNLSNLYASLGDFDKALKYEQKSSDLTLELFTENSPSYANSLLNLAEYYAVNGNYEKALDLTLNAVDIFEKLDMKKSHEYITAIQKLSHRLTALSDKESNFYKEKCLRLIKDVYGENSKEYAQMLIWTNLDLVENPKDISLQNVKKGLDILKEKGYEENEFYHSFLHFYASMLFAKGEWNELYNVLSDLVTLSKEYIYYNFLCSPESQRESLWKAIKSNLDGIEQMAVAHSQYSVDHNDLTLVNKYSELCYDVRLLKKGILLTSSKNIEKIISQIQNPRIKDLQANIIKYRNSLKNNEIDVEESDQIERTINNLERELLVLLLEENDFMKFVNISWKDIQRVLMPGEVAIEFFTYGDPKDKQFGMVFLGSEGFPLVFSIFLESELTPFMNNELTIFNYEDPSLYKTIWSVIEVFSDIKNAHTIFFSADGGLNTLGIENLKDIEGQLASDKRNLVRLSSTRELLQREERDNHLVSNRKSYPNIVLYGGLDYDAPLNPNNDGPKETNKEAVKTREITRGNAKRSFISNAQYLPGTLEEVNLLSEKFKNSNIRQYTGKNGTEQSIILMANYHPNLLHIATHGFYYDAKRDVDNTENIHKSTVLTNINDSSLSSETKAMKGTGLLFSGANHSLNGEVPYDVNNDGILTAEELANIELNEIDIAVLSACETGLGSISEEGVFGLQRGFKLAGVNSILMTLWKVDDDATQRLMQYFYDNLIKGESKVRSLKLAQDKLKATPGFEDPEFWAAFILLDAMD